MYSIGASTQTYSTRSVPPCPFRVVDAPVEIPGNTPVLQFTLDPLAGLVAGVFRPRQTVDKVPEILLEGGHLEELVGTRAIFRRVPGEAARRVLDLAGFEVAATPFITLVTASFGPTIRTGPFDVSIRKRLILDGVPGDLDLFLVDIALLVECLDDVLGQLDVRLLVCMAVVVEVDVELREGFLVRFVPVEGEVLGGDTGLCGVDCDRGPMHVRPRDKGGLLADRSERPRQNVPAHVGPEVADVEVPVRIGKATGHHRRGIRGEGLVAHGYGCRPGRLKLLVSRQTKKKTPSMIPIVTSSRPTLPAKAAAANFR